MIQIKRHRIGVSVQSDTLDWLAHQVWDRPANGRWLSQAVRAARDASRQATDYAARAPRSLAATRS